MESAVVSVLIKSDRPRKRFPDVGEMVRMEGRKGLLVVTRIDRRQRVADLVQWSTGIPARLESVPLCDIRTIPAEASRAIQEFLKS